MTTLLAVLAAMFVLSLLSFGRAARYVPPRLLLAVCAVLLIVGALAGMEMYQSIPALRALVRWMP